MTWREILKILAYNEDWISSKLLCEKFNISRTAIWKHINFLEERGFKIESSPKKGYKLMFPRDTVLSLDEEDFRHLSFGKDFYSFINIESTNSYAHKISEKVREGTIIISESQTDGRGRRGRNWVSPFGKNLYFSIILKPTVPINVISRLTIISGISIALALKIFGIDVQLKWPNDIMIGDRKIGGVLSELYSEGEEIRYVILGIGINVNSTFTDFPTEIKDIAGSLYTVTNKFIDRRLLLLEIIKILEEKYYSFISSGGELNEIKDMWNKIAFGKDRDVLITTGNRKEIGRIIGLKSDGALLANINGIIREIYAGEVLFN